MIDQLRRNVETELAILREISFYSRRVELEEGVERKLILATIKSLTNSMKILNKSIVDLLKEVSVVKKLPDSGKESNLENVKMKRAEDEIEVVVSKKDRERLLEELSISENFIRKLKGKKKGKGEKFEEFKATRGYLKLANRIFLDYSTDLINKGKFRGLYKDLKKSNLSILFETYVAMIFLTVVLSFFVSIFVILFLLFFEISFVFPFFSGYNGSILLRLLKVSWLVIGIPCMTFIVLYFYPYLERRSIAKNIDRELPFAVIHMSAISGSGISPIDIFKIIGLSDEYPNLKREIRKILNQINLYGYDLVTALNSSAKNAPSENLAELYTGLATTIHSGGNLKDFFQKRSESLLLSYRLERERYSKVAETFMDIYISVVIAAPMILMLLLVVISVANVGLNLTQFQITLIIVLIISLVNVIFLTFLHIKQPKY